MQHLHRWTTLRRRCECERRPNARFGCLARHQLSYRWKRCASPWDTVASPVRRGQVVRVHASVTRKRCEKAMTCKHKPSLTPKCRLLMLTRYEWTAETMLDSKVVKVKRAVRERSCLREVGISGNRWGDLRALRHAPASHEVLSA